MFPADMVIYSILNHFNSTFMRFVAEYQVTFIPTESFINLKMIGEPISMITGNRISPLFRERNIVLNDRSQPKCSNTQLSKIPEMVLYPFKIAPMPGEHICP